MNIPKSPAARRGMAVAALACASVLAGANFRERPTHAPSSTRVALVDIGRVQEASLEAKASHDHLEQFRIDAQKKLDPIRAQVEKNKKDQDTMAGDRTSGAFRDLLGQQVELNALGEARKRVLQISYDEEQGRILRANYLHILDAIQKVTAQEGWDVVLRDDRTVNVPESVQDDNGESHPIRGAEVLQRIEVRSVLSAGTGVDITQSVINQLNNDFAARK